MKLADLPWIALLLAVLLTGCGSDNDSAEDPEPEVNFENKPFQAEDMGDAMVRANGQRVAHKPVFATAGVMPSLSQDTSSSSPVSSRVTSLEGSLLVDLLSAKTLPLKLPPVIEGAWQQDCTQGKNGESYNSRVIYQDGKVSLYAHNYSDADCQDTLARIQMSGRFTLGQATQLESGEQVNFLSQKIDTIKAAYYGESVIEASNDLGLCGIEEWSHGELQNVTDCDAFDINAMEKNIVKIIDQQLVYGDSQSRELNGYPDRLETDISFYKAPTQLEGSWLQECKVVGQSGQSRYLEVVGNSVQEHWTLFSDTSCDNKILSQVNAYQMVLGNARILTSGESVTEMHSVLFSSEMALHSLEITDYFNHPQSILNCGSQPWQQDTFKDVLECLDIQTAFPLSTQKIVSVAESEITFGDDNFKGVDGFSSQLEGQGFIRQ